LSYVREFLPICKPGGAVVFQLPSHVAREPLPDGAYAAVISAEVPAQMRVGTTVDVPVHVRNAGTATWPRRPDELRVANHWVDARGRSVQFDSAREAITAEVPADTTIDLTLSVPAPPSPGKHVLEIDLVHEGITWFAERGSPVLTSRVEVVGDEAPRRGLLRRRPKAGGAGATAAQDALPREEPVMEMHAVHRDEVLAVVAEGGGTVVALEPNDNAAPWESYTYYLTK